MKPGHTRGHAPRQYVGRRRGDGSTVVTEGPRPLPPRLDLRRHTDGAFDWGPGEGGSAQLALALLADHLGDDTTAMRLAHEFKRRVVEKLAPDGWMLSGSQIDEVVGQLEAREVREKLPDLLGVVARLTCCKCGKQRRFWGTDRDLLSGHIQGAGWAESLDEDGTARHECADCVGRTPA